MNASERRLVENEVIFKAANDKLRESAAALLKQAGHMVMPLSFYCECSNAKCHDRVELTPHEFEAAHRNPERFVMRCGHEDLRVEFVVEKSEHYCVVKKKEMPPELK